MQLPPSDVLEAAFGNDEAQASDPDAAVRALVPLADSLAIALGEVKLLELSGATAGERERVVILRELLHRISRDTGTIVDTIDMAFRMAADKLGARQIPVGERGIVRIEPPRATWQVDVPAMRKALEALVPAGFLTEQELSTTFSTIVEEKVDNGKLNFLANNRGDEVREAIEAHRRQVPGSPMSAKVTYGQKDR